MINKNPRTVASVTVLFFSYTKRKMEKSKKIIHADAAYKMGIYGQGVGIACLDTGVSEHIELKGKVKEFTDFVNGRLRIYDDNGHGSHVAGIIAGRKCGIAPESHLYVYKVLDETGNGQMKDMLKALSYILQHRTKEIQIINISFGFLDNINKYDKNMAMNYIRELWEKGICIVCASGNRGPKLSSVTFPGVDPLVITVGCMDSFSGVGPTESCIMKPEVIAPGRRIKSLGNSMNGYGIKSGTSMAAPMVSAALALALSKNRRLTPRDLKIALYQSCTTLFDKKNTGWGLLDVAKLLQVV